MLLWVELTLRTSIIASYEDIEKACQLGAAGFLSKPDDLLVLKKKLEDIVLQLQDGTVYFFLNLQNMGLSGTF